MFVMPVILDRFHLPKIPMESLLCEACLNVFLWWCLPWQQLLTTLSLSSLPLPLPHCRKAETESGKLVTVKKNPTHLPSSSSRVAGIRTWRQLVALAGSYNLISRPRARNTSALLKYAVPNHHHSCDAKVLQWQVLMQLPLSKWQGFGKGMAFFFNLFYTFVDGVGWV